MDLFGLEHDLVGFVGLGIIYSFFPIRSLMGIGVKYEQVFLLFAVRLKLFLFSYGSTFFPHWPVELRVCALTYHTEVDG